MQSSQQSATSFYDTIAEYYDDMTAFEKRVRSSLSAYRAIVDRFRPRRVVDMGCGTGATTFVLDALGIDVTGIDPSDNMLAAARRHAAERDSRARFVRGDFTAPELRALAPVDLLLCTGNTMPHVESLERLREVLAYWRDCIAPGGGIVIQLLNYERILREGNRIVNIRKLGADTIVRFYDFTAPRIAFNILRIGDAPAGPAHTLVSTPLLPVTRDDLAQACDACELHTIEIYAGFDFAPFTNASTDLVAIIQR